MNLAPYTDRAIILTYIYVKISKLIYIHKTYTIDKRKIIHIDMDCFYAAIEIRDNPTLLDKPVAVGGSGERSVLCTCNYIARKHGIHSAMSTQVAKRKCPDLIILPVNMSKYKSVAKIIQNIFYEFTPLVEPLALDEAYLDVTKNNSHKNSATLIAEDIRQSIWQKVGLYASAGIAPNKFLAKVASGWNKPNGIFVITPSQVNSFITSLPVENIFGVGKVTLAKLHNMNIRLCADIWRFSLTELTKRFGKFGNTLYNQSRGIDLRPVEPNRPRKSLSVETTFLNDISNINDLHTHLLELYDQLLKRLQNINSDYSIKSQFIKIKFNNFKIKSAEISSNDISMNIFAQLLTNSSIPVPVRLLGIGVRFAAKEDYNSSQQLKLF